MAQGFLVNLFRAAFRLPPIEIAETDEEDYNDLAQFIQALNNWDATTTADHLPDVLDVDAYLDGLAVNTLLQSNHIYHHNYFLHQRVEDDKWEIIPRDYALTWGRNWHGHCAGLCDELSEMTPIKGSAQMANRLSQRVLDNPRYFERLRANLAEAAAQ